MGGWYKPNSSFSIGQGNFQILYLLNKLSKWLQLRLILKNRHSSLKWAQVEVISSIRLEAGLFQSWCNFQNNGKNPYNYECIYFLNELSYRPQLGLILKSWHSSLKWAWVEVCNSIRLGAAIFQSWCNFLNNGKNPYNFECIYFLKNWATDLNLGSF